MKELRFRIILIIAAIGLSLYLLYPTYQDYQNNKIVSAQLQSFQEAYKKSHPTIAKTELDDIVAAMKDSILASNPKYKAAREKRVKLGLDLQGGMYLLMEVNTTKLLEKLAKEPDDQFNQILNESEKESRKTDENVVAIFTRKMKEKNIRLSRYFGSIREDDKTIENRLLQQEADAVSRAIEIIRNRVDQYGVSEPSIQKQGSRRIVIELPGIAREEEAKRLLQGRALLEFKLLKDPDFTISIMKKIDEALAGKSAADSLNNKKDETASKKDTTNQKKLTDEQFAKEHPFFYVAHLLDPQGRTAEAFVKESDREKINAMLQNPEVKKIMPDNVEFVYEARPEKSSDGTNYYKMYLVNKEPELTGGVITDAQANIDPSTSAPVVSMQMNAEGAREWARITGSNIGKRCAIILDGGVYSAPVIQGKIPNGSSQISGMPNLDEAKLLEIVLKAGALPAPVETLEQRTVGPSLGQDSINEGVSSSLIGFVLIGIFMIIYYKTGGAFSVVALSVTIVNLLGILAGFGATLTLPGIGGIVLTMGMAVDANVIIFERIREEMALGKTLKASVDSGFKLSFAPIFDSHVTSFITGIILYQFGSGPVQGFALTLMIGLVVSLFSQLVIVRVIYDFLLNKGYKINIG
ncbi:MAG: protein translocase subunit SecD [Bacteroidota bacterium]